MMCDTGGPGAGKGTQCALLASEFSAVEHLSAGELLRKEQTRSPPSDWSHVITAHLNAGKIVPVHITLGLLRNASLASTKRVILIDGFPRNWDNVLGWDKRISSNEALVQCVICIDTPKELLLERVLKRAPTSGRDDDNEEYFVKRYDRYVSDTMQIIQHYESRNKLVRIDGTNSVSTVYRDFKAALEKYVLM